MKIVMKTLMKTVGVALVAVMAGAAAPTMVQAADFKPAVVYAMGGKSDKSFTEGFFDRITPCLDEHGVAFMDLELPNQAPRPSALPRLGRRGASTEGRAGAHGGSAPVPAQTACATTRNAACLGGSIYFYYRGGCERATHGTCATRGAPP